MIAVREPLPTVRATLRSAIPGNPTLGEILVEGPPPLEQPERTESHSAPPQSPPQDETLGQLERLADLKGRGAIDADEFARLKKALIDGL